ncbi:HIT-like protein [Lentinus tigrinus ALCF2SS1-7]|uniref:HIT-like protein n=1 Tax=Lentinus tigrinus ALCF2SS1-6 TaxID=1328759 RepID=A0A5C2SD67_9APHY|nr:HIT-like protein [Lentinus tigrinus ALCF2SS1-6]RPD75293.1 HIT-like protein [Lentinus tigrinus ALCF2SS1-7]
MLLDSTQNSDVQTLSCHGSQRIHATLFSILKMLFHSHTRREEAPLKTLDDDVEGQVLLTGCALPSAPCVFCGASKENGFDVIWENDRYIVFTDINPAAQHHLQVIPKRHIESVKSLRRADAIMVREMMEIGHKVLDDMYVSPNLRRLGFHIPPYISVSHLHLHVQALPYRSFLRRLKYPVVNGRKGQEKGFSWFVDAEQAARILANDNRVRIMPC